MAQTYKVRAGWDDYEFTSDKAAPFVVIVWEDAKSPAFYPYETEEAARRGLSYRLAQLDKRGAAGYGNYYDAYQEGN